MMHRPLALVIEAIIDRAVIHERPAFRIDDINFGGAIHTQCFADFLFGVEHYWQAEIELRHLAGDRLGRILQRRIEQ